MVNLQIERWSIALVLGEEALGRFYLVFLYQSLFLLVPTSIQSIFFPQAVRSFDESNLTSFKSIIKKQSFAMAAYDLLIMLITGLFFEAVVKLLFPLHADNTVFVYYFIPGLLAMSFVEVTGLILMASVRLRPILIGGITNLMVNIVLISVMIKFNEMTLTRMAMLKSLLYIIPLVIQLTYILFNWKTLRVGYVSKMAH
jgi:O-antigen/teichoic acid export membrane protein